MNNKIKKIICGAAAATLMLGLSACGKPYGSLYVNKEFYRFQPISDFVDFGGDKIGTIYVDTSTGVEYLYIHVGYQTALTALLNADGTPMIYKPITEVER